MFQVLTHSPNSGQLRPKDIAVSEWRQQKNTPNTQRAKQKSASALCGLSFVFLCGFGSCRGRVPLGWPSSPCRLKSPPYCFSPVSTHALPPVTPASSPAFLIASTTIRSGPIEAQPLGWGDGASAVGAMEMNDSSDGANADAECVRDDNSHAGRMASSMFWYQRWEGKR